MARRILSSAVSLSIGALFVLSATAPAAAETVEVLVIPVRFPGVDQNYTAAEIHAWMTTEVADYFDEVSFGNIDLSVRTLGATNDHWFLMPNSMASYGEGAELPILLAIHAMATAQTDVDADPTSFGGAVDWSLYDQRTPPYPVVVVVHAGLEDAANDDIRSWAVHIGAHDWFWRPPAGSGVPWPIPDDAGQTRSVTVAIASESRYAFADPDGGLHYQSGLGTYAHELLHAMAWLPDLYDDFGGFEELLGVDLLADDDDFTSRWALMGTGTRNPSEPYTTGGTLCTFSPRDFGMYPAYPTSYSQLRMGWMAGTDVGEVPRPPVGSTPNVESFVLRALEVDPAVPCPDPAATCVRAIRIPVSSEGGVHYLIEAREHLGYDVGLPRSGILVLAVDEQRGTGSGIVRVVDDTPNAPIDDPACGATNELNPLDDATWDVGQTFAPVAVDGLEVSFEADLGGGFYRVTVTYPPNPQPDVAITPWGDPDPPPYKTIDIWIDSRIELDGGEYLNDWGEFQSYDPLGNRDPVWYDHENRVYARVRNEGEGPAVGVGVRFEWGTFGAGQAPTDWHLIGELPIDLGARGDPDDTWEGFIPWTPDSGELDPDRHFCIQVELFSENDLDPSDHIAQENVTDEYTESPALRSFEVVNSAPVARRYYLQVTPDPLPAGWEVELDTASFVLEPGARQPVSVRVTPPVVAEPQMKTISVTALTSVGDVVPVPAGGISMDIYLRLDTVIELPEPAVEGSEVGVRGNLVPGRDSAPVILRYRRPDGGQLVRGVRTDPTGRFVDRFTADANGAWQVVASWPGDASLRAATSDPVPFEVAGGVGITRVVVVVTAFLFVAVFFVLYLRARAPLKQAG